MFKHIEKLEQGKQGVTGLVSIDDTIYVYKISQFMNHLTNHEHLILNGLADIKEFCPHFCNVLPLKKYPIHYNFCHKDQNPFEECEKPLYLEVLLMEYVKDSLPLYDLIKEPTIPMYHLMSYIKQVMMGIIIAQRTKDYVNYDLHSLNVLMKESRLDDVSLYVLDDENVFAVPTYGFIPVIIDHGFSYSKDILSNPSYISAAYTDMGYMSPAKDTLADAKIFLISLAEDFKECGLTKSKTKFRNIVKNFFKHIPVKWRSGWDIPTTESIITYISSYITNAHEESYLFDNYSHICMDILQTLIILPYNPHIKGSLRDLRKAYLTLVFEFSKIEKEINSPLYSLYVFRELVDIARPLKNGYMNPETSEQTVLYFKNEMFTSINKILKFCHLKNVNFEHLLCAMFSFSEQLEYQLYHMLNKCMKNKLKIYEAMEIKCIEYMYAILDINFQDTYKYNDRTVLHIYNCKEQVHDVINFSDVEDDMLHAINNTPKHSQGAMLYSLYVDSVSESERESIHDLESSDASSS
jgi:hypothetical protein